MDYRCTRQLFNIQSAFCLKSRSIKHGYYFSLCVSGAADFKETYEFLENEYKIFIEKGSRNIAKISALHYMQYEDFLDKRNKHVLQDLFGVKDIDTTDYIPVDYWKHESPRYPIYIHRCVRDYLEYLDSMDVCVEKERKLLQKEMSKIDKICKKWVNKFYKTKQVEIVEGVGMFCWSEEK